MMNATATATATATAAPGSFIKPTMLQRIDNAVALLVERGFDARRDVVLHVNRNDTGAGEGAGADAETPSTVPSTRAGTVRYLPTMEGSSAVRVAPVRWVLTATNAREEGATRRAPDDTPAPTASTLVVALDHGTRVTVGTCQRVARRVAEAVAETYGDAVPERVLLVSSLSTSCFVPANRDVPWHLHAVNHASLLFNICEHELVPTHTHQSRRDLTDLALKMNVRGGADELVASLPRIGADDPVACALGGVPAPGGGDYSRGLPTVFRIDRPTGDVAYRVVVGDHGR